MAELGGREGGGGGGGGAGGGLAPPAISVCTVTSALGPPPNMCMHTYMF